MACGRYSGGRAPHFAGYVHDQFELPALGVFGGQAFAGWSAPFLMRLHGADLAAIGKVFAPPYLLSALLGTLLGGLVADRLFRRDFDAPLRASSLATIALIFGLTRSICAKKAAITSRADTCRVAIS